MTAFFKSLIGDKAFYKRVFFITLPILIQNIITNFVSLLDNIMVGTLGTEQMSGVAIINQLLFVFNLCIFGAISGAGIFSAQFHGKGDVKGVRDTLRIKLIFVGVIAIISELIFIFFGDELIRMFLHEGKEDIDIEATFRYAKDYLAVMLVTFPPFAIMQAYSDTLRSTSETVLPMKASVVAVSTNACLNAVFIYVLHLGVVGAALATVVARFTEFFIVIIWTHTHKEKAPFVVGVYRGFKIPGALMKDVMIKGFPLLLNEAFWSLGMTAIVNAYSQHGAEVVAAQSISSTVSNLFNCAFFAFGNAVAIIVGQHLGSGNLEKAKQDDKRLLFACVVICTVVGGLMALVAPLFPMIYNTSDNVKDLAAQLLIISALFMPVHGFTHSSYFTLRSGGKTIITFIFDCGFIWAFSYPVAMLLTNFTSLTIIPLYTIVQCVEIVKVVVSVFLLKSGIWVNNLTESTKKI